MRDLIGRHYRQLSCLPKLFLFWHVPIPFNCTCVYFFSCVRINFLIFSSIDGNSNIDTGVIDKTKISILITTIDLIHIRKLKIFLRSQHSHYPQVFFPFRYTSAICRFIFIVSTTAITTTILDRCCYSSTLNKTKDIYFPQRIKLPNQSNALDLSS